MSFVIECFVIISMSLLTLSIREIRASYSDSCTQENATSCTQPQLTCSSTNICVCSPGYIPDTTPENDTSADAGIICRLPVYDEPCNETAGCQDTVTCVNVSGSMRCQCYSTASYYYSPSNGLCEPKPHLHDQCNVTIGCVSFSQCVATPPDPPTCQCNSSDLFIDDINSMCLPISYIAPSVTSVTITSSKVTFTWDGSSPESGIQYSIQWTPADGRIDDVYPEGGQVSGLRPDSHYNFTIVSRIEGDPFHSDKHFSGPNMTVCTGALYRESCRVCGTCEDTSTNCMEAEDGEDRCLCEITSFNSTPAGLCLPLEELEIANMSSVVTATTVTFTWLTNSPSTFLEYTIEWTPSEGQLDGINSSWSRVTGLTTGTFYNFSISSALPSDGFDPEKRVSGLMITVLPKPAFNESCNVNIGCQDYQRCVNQSGKMICQCDSSSQYYDVSTDQCLGRPTLNQPCDATIGCEEFYQCVGTPLTCQCNSSGTYFDSFSYQCLPMRDLQVTITSITSSSTTVSFTWQMRDEETSANYALVWTPHDGQSSNVSTQGATVSGLQPGTQYNFSVVAEASGNTYYGPNVTECTDVLYGGDCTLCSVCQDKTMTCMSAKDGHLRCLCGDLLYNKTQTGNCSPMNDLTVVNISSTSTTTSSNLTWTARTYTESETYEIKLYPAEGRVDDVSRTDGRVSGLSPGSVYYLSIISHLPADEFNDAKMVTTPVYLLKTQLAYLGNCTPYTNEDCQDQTACILSMDASYVCMCNNSSFFSEADNACINLQNLQVANISATFTATTATFSWTTSTLHVTPNSTRLTIDWTPKDGRLDRIDSTGCFISELSPQKEYHFTIMSSLPADRYYPERSVYSLHPYKTLNSPPSSSDNAVQTGIGIGVGCLVLFIIVVVGVICYKRRRPNTIPTRLQEYLTEDQSGNDGDAKGTISDQHLCLQSNDPIDAPGKCDDEISLDNLSSS